MTNRVSPKKAKLYSFWKDQATMEAALASKFQAEAGALRAENKRLRDALEELVLRCDGEEGVRADGSNIQTIAAHSLLQWLDEGE